MRRIVFVEPKSPNLHIFSRFYTPRLGVLILGTLMQRRGWEVEVIVEEYQAVDVEKFRMADLVAVSTITSTAPRAYAIADAARERNVPVIMGGPHVTFLPDEALEHADFVVRGEGEGPLMRFIDAWEGSRDFSRVPNLSYTEQGETRHNALEPPPAHLDEIPYPNLELIDGGLRSLAGLRTIPVQTSRGCPFDCSFCSVTCMFGRGYRHRSTANILGELRRYDERGNFVFFYDDNFTADRERAKELLREMIDMRFSLRWSTQVRVDVARDEELVSLMKRAGCHTVFVGLESVNPKSLLEMNKRQSLDDIKLAIQVLKAHGINIHGMFVHGFDEDDWATVEETVRFAQRARLTSYQFLILTPLPGTRLYRDIEKSGRLLTRDWSQYDSHHVVFEPKRFTPPELQWAQLYSHKRIYSIPAIIGRLVGGRLVSAALFIYAHRLNRAWQRRNDYYLKAIGLIEASVRELLRFNLRDRLARRPALSPESGASSV